MTPMRAGARFFPWILAVALVAAAAMPLAVRAAEGDEELGSVTNLPVPRYVSLRSDEINVRRGPGLDYPKDWVFHRAGLPVKIVDEYGDWRRVIDKDDAGGWVYHAMLTGRRTVLVTGENVVFRDQPSLTAGPVARAEQGVVARLRACRPDWCEIEADDIEGWVPKADIWGVDPDEVIDP